MGALAIMLVGEGGLRAWQTGAQVHIARTPALARFVAARIDESSIYAMGCFASYASTTVQVCTFGTRNAPHTAVVLGDSKAAQWVPAIQRIFERPDWRLLVITKSACPIVDATYVALPLRRDYTECAKWREHAIRTVSEMKPDVVLVSESVTYPFTKDQWLSGTRRALVPLVNSTRNLYLIRPTPQLRFNARLCAEPRGHLYGMVVSASHCTEHARSARFDGIGQWLQAATSMYPNVHVIDMTNSVCPNNTCRAELGGVIVFSDSGHMTATFAQTLTDKLSRELAMHRPQDATAGATP